MSTLAQPVGENDRTLGHPGAPVTLVEYGDYACPHCARAHPVIAQVMRRSDNSVRFAFRHFPLSQIHPRAFKAAEAAEAAGAQDKFWAMHALLFRSQDALETTDLVANAESLELDVSRFMQELRVGTHRAKVEADFRSGLRCGVNGTPTFFLNGLLLDTGWDPTSLSAAIVAARSHHASH